MHDDDDALAGIDLAAWQPPPPPAGTADAVIARMREPTSVAAVTAVEAHERAPRRVWWIGGIAVAAAAVAGLAAWGLTRAPRPGHGEVIATRAQHLELDGSTADLDAGAQVRWDRDRHRITAQQARGTARWTIADDDTLVIEPGGPGSTATIEASGASLRVEVPMNVSDIRVLGASSLTAAAVAVVTVVVYNGHVKATSGGQTVNVTPGATIELRPQSPPQEPAPRPDRPGEPRAPIAVGAAPTDIQELKAQLRAADEKIAALTAELAARQASAAADPNMAPGNVSPSALERFRVSGERNIVPDDDTKLAIDKAGKTKLIGSYKVCLDTSGVIATINRLKSTGFDAYDRLIEQKMLDWRYRPFLVDGKPTAVCTAVTFIYQQDSEPSDHRSSTAKHDSSTASQGACAGVNVDDLVAQSATQYSAGFPGAALAIIQKALACRQNVQLYRFAATYACAAHELATATAMVAKVPAQYRSAIEQKCQQEGLELREP